MSNNSKSFGFSLFKKFVGATGLGGYIKRKIDESSQEFGEALEASDPVKKILDQRPKFQTNDDLKIALLKLYKIGTQDAAEGIIKIMNNPSPLGYGYPLANGELVLFAASCLKDMDRPAYYLGNLLSVEKSWYERRNGARYALEKSRLKDNTHEDDIIANIVEVGGEEAKYALEYLVRPHYTKKAEVALERLNLAENVVLLDEHRLD